MRKILVASAAALMMIGTAGAQSAAPQKMPVQKKAASKHSSRNAGAIQGTNISGTTSDKGKANMPDSDAASKGTVGGTTGAAGSGPNASGSDTSK